jgi:hypothetical protein
MLAIEMGKPVERSGVLVVRAWVEGGAVAGLRARITQSHDLTRSEQTMTTTATAEGVMAAVQAWLDALLSGPDECP